MSVAFSKTTNTKLNARSTGAQNDIACDFISTVRYVQYDSMLLYSTVHIAPLPFTTIYTVQYTVTVYTTAVAY